MSRVAIAYGADWLAKGSEVRTHAANIWRDFFILGRSGAVPKPRSLGANKRKRCNCGSSFINEVPENWTNSQASRRRGHPDPVVLAAKIPIQQNHTQAKSG